MDAIENKIPKCGNGETMKGWIVKLTDSARNGRGSWGDGGEEGGGGRVYASDVNAESVSFAGGQVWSVTSLFRRRVKKAAVVAI